MPTAERGNSAVSEQSTATGKPNFDPNWDEPITATEVLGVSADTVYTMTRSMFDNLDQMVAAHAAAKAIRKESAATGMPLPLHPGAEKYYREAGVLK